MQMSTANDIREAETEQAGQARHRDRELERAIRHALVLAVGKRVADQAHRRAVSNAHGRRPARLVHLTAHLAGYGMLLAYIWHQHRTPKRGTA
jgi:hypothetical protein